jgi:hypothetical protein
MPPIKLIPKGKFEQASYSFALILFSVPHGSLLVHCEQSITSEN